MKNSILSELFGKAKNSGDEPYSEFPEFDPENSRNIDGDPGTIPHKGISGGNHLQGGSGDTQRSTSASPGGVPLKGDLGQTSKERSGEDNPIRGVSGSGPVGGHVDKQAANDAVHHDSSGSEPIQGNRPRSCPRVITALGVAELMEKDLPERRLLMAPWLPERGIAMIYAARGIGKTFLALEIALAVASGSDFLGWKTEGSEKILYLDGEMSLNDIQSRIRKMDRGRKEQIRGQIEFISPEMQDGPCPDLSLTEWHRHLAPYAERAKLIIVDNISTLCRTGNENDADSWQIVQQWAIQQKSAGRTVLFIHHAGKGGQQRGTSKREDVMDTVIALKRPGDYTAKQGARFEVHFEKARGFSGDDAEPFVVQLRDEVDRFEWSVDNLEETSFQQVAEMLGLGMTQSEITEELGLHKSTVSRYARRAKEEGAV